MARRSWITDRRVMRLRHQSRPVDVAVRALDGFRRHRTGRNAALITHYGFLSIFPLLFVAATILGFVLEDRPDLQEDIIDSVLARIPVIGQQIKVDPAAGGSVVVLVSGLLIALWASLKAFVIIQSALDDVAEIPIDERPGLAMSRLRALEGIAMIGVAQVATVILTGYVFTRGVLALHQLLFVFTAALVNGLVLMATYCWLCSARPPWRTVIPGCVIGGILFALLQMLGTAVVSRAIAKASPIYGTFASVIGLLTWMSVHATIALCGAELNRALSAPPISTSTT
jgi:uncharacterized BrkB/YihY/UPF0761 family membrane protein